MTWALCFACGDTKFGAICPCPRCGVASTGDMTLDILFSDHYMARSTLEQFGEAVKVIQEEAGETALGLSAFLYHTARTYPDLLRYEPPEQMRQPLAALLAGLDLPDVEILPGHRAAWEDEEEDRDGAEKQSDGRRSSWWRFWQRGP